MRSRALPFLFLLILSIPLPAAFAASGGDPDDLTGKVLEKIDAGTYTYLRLETAKGETWAAVPHSEPKLGESVAIASPMAMDGFESRTLQRKFDRIWFGALRPSEESAASGAAAPAPAHHGAAAAPMSAPAISVARAEGAAGRTVAEVFADRKSLSGQSIFVRAQVTKVSRAILGRNWIHLSDGSGSAAKGDSDLLVTSDALPKVGDVVLVTGTVGVDRDFGSGYKYSVLVESAKVEPAASRQ